MKPHLVVKLARGAPAPDAPHWSAIVRDKAQATEQLTPVIDRVLRDWTLPVWVAKEYRAASGAAWNAAEIAAGLDRVYRLVVQTDRVIPYALIDALRALPIVEEARAGEIARVPLPRAEAQSWAPRTDQESRDAIFLPDAHRKTMGDDAIVIAVLDTGICRTHPELASSLIPGFDFVDILDGHDEFVGDFLDADADPDDDVGHGTHVAGIIAGKGLRMPVGVAPRCRILPVRTLGAMRQGDLRIGAGLVDNINNSFKYAIDHGARVINASIGIPHTGGGLPHAEVVDYARRKGVTIVAAAGNDGQSALYYPGALPHVVAAGAFGEDGDVAVFSTYGNQITCIAPGENIYSSHLEDSYAFASGTSQAAPFVTGAIALLIAHARAVAGHTLTDAQVKHVLKHSSDKVDARFKHPRAGFGRLNLRDALRLVEQKLSAETRIWPGTRAA